MARNFRELEAKMPNESLERARSRANDIADEVRNDIKAKPRQITRSGDNKQQIRSDEDGS
jgi:hypothetical protein